LKTYINLCKVESEENRLGEKVKEVEVVEITGRRKS
jgi:hypothetical protein